MSVRTGVDEYNQPISDINSGYIGEFKYFGFSDVPPHCLACDGSAVSRTTYPELFAAIGTTWGAGDGSTTFNLPDFTSVGAFLRSTGGNAEALGTEQGDAIRNITASSSFRNMAEGYNIITDASGALGVSLSSLVTAVAASNDSASARIFAFDASRVVPTADENRPVNYAVNICIVYE